MTQIEDEEEVWLAVQTNPKSDGANLYDDQQGSVSDEPEMRFKNFWQDIATEGKVQELAAFIK